MVCGAHSTPQSLAHNEACVVLTTAFLLLSTSTSWSISVATTKYPRLGNLQVEGIYFSQFWGLTTKRFSFCWELLSLFQDGAFLLYPGEGGWTLCPHVARQTSMNWLLQALLQGPWAKSWGLCPLELTLKHTLNIITLAIKFQCMNLGTYSDHSTPQRRVCLP